MFRNREFSTIVEWAILHYSFVMMYYIVIMYNVLIIIYKLKNIIDKY